MAFYVFLGLFCLTPFVFPSDQNQLVCYNAKTCIHNAKEKCGISQDGDVRRFFDTCDMLEYNCLRSTEYEKTTQDKCASLPPLDPTRRKGAPGRLAVIKKYWCWRAKYCHTKTNPICARDRRLKNTRAFQCECTMYKHNCEQGHDYTATGGDIKTCMKHGHLHY